MGAAVDSVRLLVSQGKPAVTPPLDPKFAYLRVTRGKQVGLLYRGSIERAADGDVEVYYGSSGEVLRLQQGRIAGVLGLPTEWRRVETQAPEWGLLAAAQEPRQVLRVRDVMPGYRSGVRDRLTIKAVPPPAGSALQALDPGTLMWFEESMEVAAQGDGRPIPGSEALPPARYALSASDGRHTVVYGEQCLAVDLCFTWQRWSSAVAQQAAAPAAR